MIGICPKCQRPHGRSKTGPCARCYMAVYLKDPERRKKHVERVQAYNRRNQEKYRVWKRRWELRVGARLPPDFKDLRCAVRFLEDALAKWTKPRTVKEFATQVRDVATMLLNGEIEVELVRAYSPLARTISTAVGAEVARARILKREPDLTLE